MSDDEPSPFEGFRPSNRMFHVTGYDLKVIRRWQRDSNSSNLDQQLALVVEGVSVSESDQVSVVGSEHGSAAYDLKIQSENILQDEWNADQRLFALAAPDEGAPARRLREFQCEIFSNRPPTATLSFDGGWTLDCGIPDVILHELTEALLATKVTSVHIAIDWVGGFEKFFSLEFGRKTWGMFSVGKETSATPLRGHIIDFQWTSGGKLTIPTIPEFLDFMKYG